MVKYDGTVRTSKEQVIQFLYGEDGMAGEHIEDMRIDLKEMNNATLTDKCSFLGKDDSSQGGTQRQENLIAQAVGQDSARAIIQDPSLMMKLKQEFKQLQQDRDDLRNIILKCPPTNEVHLPVNVPRIIWNAKQQFKIRPNQKTDLMPDYVLQEITNLSNELTSIPGI
jgi:DNA-directed RNA polymerase II subunit RPB1